MLMIELPIPTRLSHSRVAWHIPPTAACAAEFSMTISYLRGEDNHLSDQLSRAPDCIVPVWGTNCRRCRIRIAVLLVTKNTYTYLPLDTYLIYIALRTTLTSLFILGYLF